MGEDLIHSLGFIMPVRVKLVNSRSLEYTEGGIEIGGSDPAVSDSHRTRRHSKSPTNLRVRANYKPVALRSIQTRTQVYTYPVNSPMNTPKKYERPTPPYGVVLPATLNINICQVNICATYRYMRSIYPSVVSKHHPKLTPCAERLEGPLGPV